MRKRIRFVAAALAVGAAFAAFGAGTAAAGPPWKQPPRGNDQASLFNCEAPVAVLFDGDTCVAAFLAVPPTGEALANGSFELTVPAGTTLTGNVIDAFNYGGANDCTWDDSSSVSGQTLQVSGLTCPQDSGFVVFFEASVGSSPGAYTLSGDYKVNNSRRGSSNVFRYAEDPTVEVFVGL
jgi:hypothetical protein